MHDHDDDGHDHDDGHGHDRDQVHRHDRLTIDRAAPVDRLDLDATAWVHHVRGFVRDAEHHFDHIVGTTAWEQSEVLRYDRYVPERRLVAALPAQRRDAPALLRQVDLHLSSVYRQRFSGATAILYRDGADFQGLHSDREMRWLDDTLIAIVVLGQRRPFVFRPRRPLAEVVDRVPAGAGPDDIVLTPGEGDLLVMGGTAQVGWLHGVPACDTDRPRVSLTWRWTSRRGRPDTAPGYFDGRQFSDRPRRPGTRRAR